MEVKVKVAEMMLLPLKVFRYINGTKRCIMENYKVGGDAVDAHGIERGSKVLV